ncbi:MAG: TIGR03619 family F420-dependent LLM class oxidoreductase [Acidimicrobiia bacterium]|nr:TIGR03619 family F420-dependent LLM class oxidoreductase [Acidimicrobiia bacterium]
MRFSYAESMIDPTLYAPLVQAAEQAGFDSFVVPDSICYPLDADTTYPYNADGSREFLEGKPFIEPFSLIPSLAAVTERIRFTTFVVKLPIRHPALVAKQVTSIGVITGERFGFGVGTSPWREDYDVTGVPWERRGARMDECIEIINGLQSGDFFGYSGDFYEIPEIQLCPVPAQRVPILVGGHSAMALERAGRLGDGWIHAGGDPDELARMMSVVEESRRRHDRADQPFEVHAISVDAYDPEGIERLEAAGVTDVIVGFRDAYSPGPDTQPLDEKLAALQWYADEILAKVR